MAFRQKSLRAACPLPRSLSAYLSREGKYVMTTKFMLEILCLETMLTCFLHFNELNRQESSNNRLFVKWHSSKKKMFLLVV